MRAALSTLLAAAVATSGFTLSTPAQAMRVAAAEPTPEQLYDQGRTNYRLGNYDKAVTAWEQAYALSDNPLLLYNISLAYKGLFGMTKDIADLRKAKAVLDNFIKLANADPELDEDDAPERLAEIEKMIEAEEERLANLETDPDKGDPGQDTLPTPEGPDPGRKLRFAGIGAMSAGGVFIIVGGSLGLYYAVQSQEFSNELSDWVNLQRMDEGEPGFADPMDCENILGIVDDPTRCQAQLEENENTARRNGRNANRGAIVAFALGGGLGAIALVTGGILFAEGNRRTRKWEQGTLSKHQIRVLPTRGGLSISGKF